MPLLWWLASNFCCQNSSGISPNSTVVCFTTICSKYKYSPGGTPFDSIRLRVIVFQKQPAWFLTLVKWLKVIKIRLRLCQWRLFFRHGANKTPRLIGCFFQIIIHVNVWSFRRDKRRNNRSGRLLRGGALAAGERPRRGWSYYQHWTWLRGTEDRNIGGQDGEICGWDFRVSVQGATRRGTQSGWEPDTNLCTGRSLQRFATVNTLMRRTHRHQEWSSHDELSTCRAIKLSTLVP